MTRIPVLSVYWGYVHVTGGRRSPAVSNIYDHYLRPPCVMARGVHFLSLSPSLPPSLALHTRREYVHTDIWRGEEGGEGGVRVRRTCASPHTRTQSLLSPRVPHAVYVHVYASQQKHQHTRTLTRAHTDTHTHTHTRATYARTHVHLWRVRMRACLCVRVCVCTCVCTCVCVRAERVRAPTCARCKTSVKTV